MSDSVNSGPSPTVQNKVCVHCANQSPCSALQTQINIRLQIEVDIRQYKQTSMSDFVNYGPYLIIQAEVNYRLCKLRSMSDCRNGVPC